MRSHYLIALLLALALPGASVAQSYPNHPLKLIVPYAPGGGVDWNARLIGTKLAGYLGQQVLVENRPGAGTNIGNVYVAQSAPDGYTLLVNGGTLLINMTLYKKPGFDALRDFAPVSVFSASHNVLVVGPKVAAKNMAELVALARANPGKLNYSTAGNGSTQHLTGELFKTLTKTDIVHVPYKGTAPSLTALIAGDVDLSFSNIPAVLGHIKSGKLRPLAATAAKRSEILPAVPTMKESGYDMNVVAWYGIFAPAATPRDIVNKLSAAIARAANDPDIKRRLLDSGAEPVGSSPEEFARQMRAEASMWAGVVKASGATIDE